MGPFGERSQVAFGDTLHPHVSPKLNTSGDVNSWGTIACKDKTVHLGEFFLRTFVRQVVSCT
jgi:hypothetical protein